ncbi:MAG TPA: DUF4430 domain-containing protein [Candidatus Magasanikbacteria bacterium]|nr:DUF4430 domain-containing protein [Candidatus Magasanikbacteria bacterium]
MRQKLLFFLITIFSIATLVSGYWWSIDDPPKISNTQIDTAEKNNTKQQETKITESSTVNKPITNHQAEDNKKIKTTNTTAEPPDTPTSTEKNTEEIFEAKVTLQISDKNFPIPYEEDMTAEDVMKEVRSRYPESFWYESIDYGGDLGTFVKSINGIAENYREKMYWILYINGNKSNKGISILKLKPDDIIMWNYEKEIL